MRGILDAPSFDHARGWVAIPQLLDAATVQSLIDACEDRLGDLGADLRVGDKPASGTRRLAEAADRLGEVAAVVAHSRLQAMVEAVVGPEPGLSDVVYRCPQPGFGGQRLHADDLPKLDDGPDRCATAIITLCDFTADNGATRVIDGSHRRPDLQRRSGSLDDHPDAHPLTAPAGTAFVFTGHLLHAGWQNQSDAPRPALQITWRRA